MRDDQMRRYARHILLPEVGGDGQRALMASRVRLALPDRVGRDDAAAARVAARFLVAGGVGTVVVPDVDPTSRADLAAHALDGEVSATGTGDELELPPRPAWWPACDGDDAALACWRGGLAATTWMAARATRAR